MYSFMDIAGLEAAEKELSAKLNDPKTPQGDVKNLQSRLHECRRILKIRKDEQFVKTQGISVSGSDDYIGAGAGDMSFYYGYEETVCPKHGTDRDKCGEDWCDTAEWAFVAEKNGVELARYARSELDYGKADCVERYLILGMCKFIKENMK